MWTFHNRTLSTHAYFTVVVGTTRNQFALVFLNATPQETLEITTNVLQNQDVVEVSEIGDDSVLVRWFCRYHDEFEFISTCYEIVRSTDLF